MTKLNFKKPFKNLDGSEETGSDIGKYISQHILAHGKGDTLKLWGWAVALNSGEELSLDASDLETFKRFIKEGITQQGQPVFNVYTGAQILLEIREAEKQEEDK